MERDTIEKMLNFLKEKEGRKLPEAWFDSIKKLELVKELENHPNGTQYRYEGDLNLDKTNIIKLPNDLHVDGYLSLRGCSQLTKLPDDLHVTDSLIIVGTSIKEIPNKLYVGWNLFIGNTSLAEKYTNAEIRKIVTSKDGKIKNGIVR